MQGGAFIHNIERGPPKNHPSQVWLNLVWWFQRRKFTTDNRHQVMSHVTPMKTIGMMLVSAIFRQFGSCYGLFDIAG